MKNEYLCRTATFTAKNLDKLFEEIGEELVGRPDCDLRDVLTIATASRLMVEGLTIELSAGSKDTPVTLRGEDFAVKAIAAVSRVGRVSMLAHTDREDEDASVSRVFEIVGACAYLTSLAADKLYDSDHIEEHKAVKNEKEETDE